MRRMIALVLLALGLTSAPAAAQASIAWAPDHRAAADWISYGTVAASVAVDTLESWRAADRGAAFKRQALRLGGTIASAEAIKRLVRKPRPDGSDRLSLPSEHTAIACASAGSALTVSIPLAFGTGYHRMAAFRHDWIDVASGCALGGAFAYWIR